MIIRIWYRPHSPVYLARSSSKPMFAKIKYAAGLTKLNMHQDKQYLKWQLRTAGSSRVLYSAIAALHLDCYTILHWWPRDWQWAVGYGLHLVGITACHYDDVIMTTIVSQITSLTSVYSTVYSDVGQRKHQSSASLAFVWRIFVWLSVIRETMTPTCDIIVISECYMHLVTIVKGNEDEHYCEG